MTEYQEKKVHTFPMVPIRDVVVFPHMMVPFVIGRESSVMALERALQTDKKIYLATQKDASEDNPSEKSIYRVGTVANIAQSLKLPDGNIRVLVEGVRRAQTVRIFNNKGYFEAEVEYQPVPKVSQAKMSLLTKRLNLLFEDFAKLNPNVNYETILQAARNTDTERLADTIAANLPISVEDKQTLLEIIDPAERMEKICEFIEIEIEKIKMDKSVQNRVRKQMEKAQREYYLNEKIKAIQKELGRDDKSEIEELREKIEAAKMPKDAYEKAMNELRRLEQMPPMSAESTVARTYLDWLVAVPWQKRSRELRDIEKAEQILNEDHYGLEKVKERILEFLAVRQLLGSNRRRSSQGSILCFVGPPGVGKTSLGRSIARATGRKFVRQSLGGVRDEAEIRGHRRTYIGALPGQIIQSMKKAGTRNPVFLLDEIDKMSMDFRGDPSAALMEVLDPEHNKTFVDHYLDTEYDLSEVLFVCTANVLHTIPRPLRDRMEIIEISGYTELEKLNIAKRHLVKKQLEETGLKDSQVRFTDDGLLELIRYYTRESGVRNLEREIGNVLRKVARRVVGNSGQKNREFVIDSAQVQELLGVRKHRHQLAAESNEVGLATGLAWTDVGGQVLLTEATTMEGKGELQLTGKLGDVMQESAKAALSFVRSRSSDYGLLKDFHKLKDMHVHIPEGAIPKDGPSAGITLATTIISALSGIPVRRDVAMTGEITLRGKVLPIGGVKEKVLAAHRAGIKTVILPKENEKDLNDIPESVLEELKIVLVETMDEVLEVALEKPIQESVGGKGYSKKQPPKVEQTPDDRPGVH
ncbi:MAG TPA: endopeptidase La [Acidobacteriota bacterium]|nr:endopeptidase La [Acidobacteriota bacterium]